MVRRRLAGKLSNSIAGRAWLVLWSNHYSLARFDAEIANEIDRQLQTVTSPYERSFYVHFSPGGAIHEIVLDAPNPVLNWPGASALRQPRGILCSVGWHGCRRTPPQLKCRPLDAP